MEKNLFEILSQFFPLSLELKSIISDKMRYEVLNKNQIILSPGEINRRIYFITHGLMRAYYMKDGIDVTTWIKGDGEFVVSVASFYPQVPSVETLEVLEETQVFYIYRDELFTLYREHLEFSYIGLNLTIPVLVEWDEWLHVLRMTTAEERFEWFMKRKAHLLERIPAKIIASYLSMSPETLSRVRAKYRKAA